MLRATLLGVALLLPIACRTPPEPPAPGLVDHCGRVVVAPVSFNQHPPEELEPGIPVLQEALEGYLVERGCEVVTVPLADFHDAWQSNADAVGSLYDAEGVFDPARYDRAVGLLLPRLREQHGAFDALVITYLLPRLAEEYSGHTVKWDGVEQHSHIRLPTLYFGKGPEAPASSVRALVYAADGSRLQEAYGGIELLQESRKTELGYYTIAIRSDLFEDRQRLRQGVAAALLPYLGAPGAAP